jgi:hypothetical protein
MKISVGGAEFFHADRHRDGRTDKHGEANSIFFRSFANAPKIAEIERSVYIPVDVYKGNT